MSCPKCKDTYTQVAVKSLHAATPDELKTVGTHLCSSCDTKLVTKGVGKQAKDVLVHTCKVCGSEDVSCCLMKKGSGPTTGMEQK
jgi:CRISPR/Cas system-associated protein Cas10 (large subunit of type III CRISPR-Cas system)